MTAMINLSKLNNESRNSNSSIQSVSVKNEIKVSSDSNKEEREEKEIAVHYGPENSTDEQTLEQRRRQMLERWKMEKLESEVEFLKMMVEIFRTQDYEMKDGRMVLHAQQLLNLVKLLTGADDVSIDVEEVGCFNHRMRKITSIYVIKDNESINMKYSDSDNYRKLTDYFVNMKWVIVE